jgi:nitrous oxide reductase accessory protein NosL
MPKLSVLIMAGLLCATFSVQAADLQLPGKQDRCPVCGMFVAPYPNWTSIILFKDKSQLFFDGAKDLYRYYSALPEQNAGQGRKDIAGIYLTDYYSTRLLPVEQLLLVLGSDVYGPMGPELVPVAGKEAAATFAQDHGGTEILRFDQLSPQLVPGN